MAKNTIKIEFSPCQPTPVDGYIIRYRVLGSDDEYRTAGPFFNSPAQVDEFEDVAGTSYEGFIQGNCGGGKFGVSVPFVAPFNGSIQAPSSEAPGGSSAAPSSEAPGGNISGNIQVQPCADGYSISQTRYNGINMVGSFPISPGGSTSSAIPPGTYTIRVTVLSVEGAPSASITVTDSNGVDHCQDITTGGMYDFPGVVISDMQDWNISLNCGSCE